MNSPREGAAGGSRRLQFSPEEQTGAWSSAERRAALWRAFLTPSGFICRWGHSTDPGGLRMRQLQKRIQAQGLERGERNSDTSGGLSRMQTRTKHFFVSLLSCALSPKQAQMRLLSSPQIQHRNSDSWQSSDFQSPGPQAAGSPRPLERTNQASSSRQPCQPSPQGASGLWDSTGPPMCLEAAGECGSTNPHPRLRSPNNPGGFLTHALCVFQGKSQLRGQRRAKRVWSTPAKKVRSDQTQSPAGRVTF